MNNGVPFGQLDPVKRLMTGFFNMNPPLPRYSHIWDVNLVLVYLKSLFPLEDLSLKDLTLKLTMLLALVTGQRIQTLSLLDLKYCTRGRDVVFSFTELLKHSRVGKPTPTVRITPYADKALCVVETLNLYIERTKSLRSSSRLLISFVKPHSVVSRDTLSRWLRTVMATSGINTEQFKAHSCRSATHSKASQNFVPIDIILQAGGWSNARTFQMFYNREQNSTQEFSNAVLNIP